ncbi:MAG: M23 family metallopeptidase [Chitinophagales bacterium]
MFLKQLIVAVGLVLLCSSNTSYGQNYPEYPYPAEFGNPLGIDWKLSGTFGEPRGNHFHAGTDIKTNGAVGYKLYAVQDGYVARIKVSPYGYGNALYIAHPNGYTSVYAHMSEFNTQIDSLLKHYQYATQEFEQDIYLDSDKLKVKKGDIIGLSGNSGGSAGPHLHFELRESNSQFPINPLLFGYEVLDNKPPTINGIKVTSIPEGKSYYDVEGKRLDLLKGEKGYYLKDTLLLDKGAIAIGFHGYDQQTLTTNKNGIFRVEMFVNDERYFVWTMDKTSFDQGRYVNAFRDFYEQKYNRTIYNCFRLPGNYLDVYEYLVNDGFVKPNGNEVVKVNIEVWDFHQNKSKIELFVQAKNESATTAIDSNTTLVNYNQNVSVKKDGFAAYFPQGTFYDDVNMYYERRKNQSSSIYSDNHQLHNKLIPLHKSAVIQVDPINLPEKYKDKAVMMHKDFKNVEQVLTTFWKDNMVSARCKEVGTFYVKIDSLAPTINVLNYTEKTKTFRGDQIRLKISDNLAGIEHYKGFIDDQWVLFEYDAKRNALTYNFDKYCPKGEHNLKVLVTDGVGNVATKEISFVN